MNQTTTVDPVEPRDPEAASEQLGVLRDVIRRRVVGHDALLDGVLACLLGSGHVLIEGVPGVGKTLLVKSLGEALALEFSRIQFTPDLMPADIVGTEMVMLDDDNQRHFEFRRGPVFSQLLLADEINRATPRTQSALLEAMEERQVSVGRTSHALDEPFMVLATQNPIEMEGTYPLPEAQLDRFMLKLEAPYPSAAELGAIADRMTGEAPAPLPAVLDGHQLTELRAHLRGIVIARHVQDHAVRLVRATHPDTEVTAPLARDYVRYGASPRGLLSVVLAAKAAALFDGRLNVSFDDIDQVAAPALRHRLLLNFEGEAEGIGADAIIAQVVETTPRQAADATR